LHVAKLSTFVRDAPIPLGLGWGRLADLATASNQLIGASFSQCHVALYVVDLKRVQPFCGVNIPEKEPKESSSGGGAPGAHSADLSRNVTFRPGQTVRRSFVREKPTSGGGGKSQPPAAPPQVKISEETTSDKSGTEGEDSDAVASHADIPDINHYETIFRPRNRELNRTPPADEPFDDPEMEMMPMPVNAKLQLTKQKIVTPSPPTRRASQPAMTGPSSASSSTAYPQPSYSGSTSRRGSTTGLHPDVMRPQEVHLRSTPHSGTVAQRPYSVYGEGEGGGGRGSGRPASQSVPRELGPPPGSPVRAAYRTAISLASPEQEEYLPEGGPSSYPQQAGSSVPYHHHAGSPVSRLQPSSPVKAYPPSAYPGGPLLDRPTAVRPHRASEGSNPYYYPPRGTGNHNPDESSSCLPPQSDEGQQQKMIPAMADRPCGLNTSDFLPQKFGGLKIGLQATGAGSRGLQHSPSHQGGGSGGGGGGGGGGFGFEWPATQLSESEVTSAILRDHTNIEAVLRGRHRHLEIIRQLWQTKDAKTAVEQVGDLPVTC
jgi:hypothetical protein